MRVETKYNLGDILKTASGIITVHIIKIDSEDIKYIDTSSSVESTEYEVYHRLIEE